MKKKNYAACEHAQGEGDERYWFGAETESRYSRYHLPTHIVVKGYYPTPKQLPLITIKFQLLVLKPR